ncbi:hypothetical protein IP92_03180 [Pseudoduganella flava]|uniref:Alpha/beta hydrolase n=1 Tax=Pseudoduganella flava TaxID=871742 RepID=A0A562PQU6_9BURK|nr:hypothetical protein IP92_03180 [Pseudoduganella flava]
MSRYRMLLACALLLACVAGQANDDLPAPQEARVPSDPGVVLAATLRLPAGPGPHPIVLLLSGGGASRRGVFNVLADRLLALASPRSNTTSAVSAHPPVPSSMRSR